MPATASTVPETGRTLVATTDRRQELQEEAEDTGMGEEEEEENPGNVVCCLGVGVRREREF